MPSIAANKRPHYVRVPLYQRKCHGQIWNVINTLIDMTIGLSDLDLVLFCFVNLNKFITNNSRELATYYICILTNMYLRNAPIEWDKHKTETENLS